MEQFNKSFKDLFSKMIVLNEKQMKQVIGGGLHGCQMWCNRLGGGESFPVPDCDRATAEAHCPDLSKTQCNCVVSPTDPGETLG